LLVYVEYAVLPCLQSKRMPDLLLSLTCSSSQLLCLSIVAGDADIFLEVKIGFPLLLRSLK